RHSQKYSRPDQMPLSSSDFLRRRDAANRSSVATHDKPLDGRDGSIAVVSASDEIGGSLTFDATTHPLMPATAVTIFNREITVFRPRGGQLLTMVNFTPASCSALT